MLIPNRHGNSPAYRYGFQGQEKDDELKGEGNSYDFGARMYDPRVGRWFARDPKESKFPSLSTYNFAYNNPLRFVDPTGMAPQEGDPGKGSFWKSVKSFFGFGKKEGRTATERNDGSSVTIPEPLSLEWFAAIFSFDAYKNSYKDTEFNKQRDIFINKALPEIAEGSKQVIEQMEYVPGVDLATSVFLHKNYEQATINGVLTFLPVQKFIPKPVKKVAGEIIYTAIGRMDDLAKYDIFTNVDTWRKSGLAAEVGKNLPTWKQNKQWLQEKIDRGDVFILSTDPNSLPSVLGGYIEGVPNGYFTAREYDYLTKKGAKIIHDY